jgi:hypothetical protein
VGADGRGGEAGTGAVGPGRACHVRCGPLGRGAVGWSRWMDKAAPGRQAPAGVGELLGIMTRGASADGRLDPVYTGVNGPRDWHFVVYLGCLLWPALEREKEIPTAPL